MTIAELDRLIASKKRLLKLQQQEQASFDYILADLIGRSVARVYNSSNTLPEISAAYPTLFDGEDIQKQKQAKKIQLSALRFKQFADSYNKRFRGANSSE